MQLLKNTLAITFFIINLSHAATAGIYNNKFDWDRLDPLAKSGYATGAFDSWLLERKTNSFLQEIYDCMLALDIKVGDLVEIIEFEYSDVEKWTYPPSRALMNGIKMICEK